MTTPEPTKQYQTNLIYKRHTFPAAVCTAAGVKIQHNPTMQKESGITSPDHMHVINSHPATTAYVKRIQDAQALNPPFITAGRKPEVDNAKLAGQVAQREFNKPNDDMFALLVYHVIRGRTLKHDLSVWLGVTQSHVSRFIRQYRVLWHDVMNATIESAIQGAAYYLDHGELLPDEVHRDFDPKPTPKDFKHFILWAKHLPDFTEYDAIKAGIENGRYLGMHWAALASDKRNHETPKEITNV